MIELERDDMLAAAEAVRRAEATLAAAQGRSKQAAEAFVHATAVAERAEQVDQRIERSDADLRALAAGRPWYAGLMDHQWTGMRFGFGAERFILGDGMGLGKTRQVIGWMDLVGSRRAIIVALAEVAPQFAGEVEELAPHRRVVLLTGLSPVARKRALDSLGDDAVVVVNFELFSRKNDTLDRLVAWAADTVVVDEAHTLKAKGARANLKALVLAQNVDFAPRGDYPLDRYLATRSVKYVALTTGTPILNEPGDIHPLLHLCDPLLFPSLAAFKRQYTVSNFATGRDEFKPGGLMRLKKLLSAFYISRSLEDAGIQLPPQKKHVVKVVMDAETYPVQHRITRQLTNHAKITLESGQTLTIMEMIALLTRRRQANVFPAGIEIVDQDEFSPTYGEVLFSVAEDCDESAKLDAVVEQIMACHQEGKRQVVFSQFKTALAELERRLAEAGLSVARFDGDTAKAARVDIRHDFYRGRDQKFDVVLVNYKTGGTGLNLIGATVTHILDSEWNPGKRDQALARTHRIGQTAETEVFEYVMDGVDSYMRNILRQKEQMLNDFDTAPAATRTEAELLVGALLS